MLCSPGESGTHCVAQAGLRLTSFCPGLQDARIPVMHHHTDTFAEIYVQVLEVMLGKGRTYDIEAHRHTNCSLIVLTFILYFSRQLVQICGQERYSGILGECWFLHVRQLNGGDTLLCIGRCDDDMGVFFF